MKLLLIGPCPPPITGNSIINDAIIHNFSQYHHDIEVDFINVGTPAFEIPFGKLNLKKLFIYLSPYRSMHKIFFADVITVSVGHTFLGILKYLPFLLLSKLSAKQLIVHVHTDFLWTMFKDAPSWKQRILTAVMGLADKGIVLSSVLRRNLQPFLKDDHIYELPNFISASLLEHDLPKTLTEKKQYHLSILFLGTLRKEKGIIDFLEAMLILKKRNLDFEVHIAGDIPVYMRAEIDRYFEKIQDILHYHGIVTGDKKKALFLQTNIFVFPTHNEAQGIVLLEAMATGNIILSTNVGGIPDIFVADKNGFTIESNNPAQIADIISSLQEKHKETDLDRMLRENYTEVAQKYTEEKFFENLYKIIMDKSCGIT